MKLPNIAGLAGVGKAFVMANRPEILFGASVVATVAAVVAAARGGYKSGQQVLIEEVGGAAKIKELTNKEKASLTWMNYLPAAGLTASALGSTTGLHLVHVKEKKALAATALMAMEEVKKEAKDYKEKALEFVKDDSMTPEEKQDAIDALELPHPTTSEFRTGDGYYACWDDLANRSLRSNQDMIRRATQVLLTEIEKEGHGNLNIIYEELDMEPSQLGSQMGWTKEDVQGYGGTKGMEFVCFGLTNLSDGSPAVSFWFREPPTSDYEARAFSNGVRSRA